MSPQFVFLRLHRRSACLCAQPCLQMLCRAGANQFECCAFGIQQVWFTTRVTGTHTGTLKFGGSEYKATGRVVQVGPVSTP